MICCSVIALPEKQTVIFEPLKTDGRADGNQKKKKRPTLTTVSFSHKDSGDTSRTNSPLSALLPSHDNALPYGCNTVPHMARNGFWLQTDNEAPNANYLETWALRLTASDPRVLRRVPQFIAYKKMFRFGAYI